MISIIIPVLNSHEILRRQLLYFNKLDLAGSEVIIVDDGSDPEIVRPEVNYNLGITKTNDKRSWTQPIARNIGANKASGEVLIFTDIDHIITNEIIDFAKNLKYDYSRFKRELGVLDEDGNFTQDRDVLLMYGIPYNRGLRISCHTLSMAIKRSVFEKTGGFRENVGQHPTHDDGNMKRKLDKIKAIKCPDNERPTIYMIPNGRYAANNNPFGYFHNLER